MTVYYLQSTGPNGITVTTRHYGELTLLAEQGRRQMAGHTAITAQAANFDPATATETCTKRAPLPKGGAHA